jgi:hypothetical protein
VVCAPEALQFGLWLRNAGFHALNVDDAALARRSTLPSCRYSMLIFAGPGATGRHADW